MAHVADILMDMDFDRETITAMSASLRCSSGGPVELYGHAFVVPTPQRGSIGRKDSPVFSAPSPIFPGVCAFSKPPCCGNHRSGLPSRGRSTGGTHPIMPAGSHPREMKRARRHRRSPSG